MSLVTAPATPPDAWLFAPDRHHALARLAAVDPADYARTRNYLNGAVTYLSPYLTHGILSLREVYTQVHQRTPLAREHKLVFELGWRAYWRHVWAYRGDAIHHPLHPGVLPEAAYATTLPLDVVEARTGIPVIDQAVQTLYSVGYLHNHARLWLASYLVHMRKVHWHAGAQWMLGHLLDGDIASNHLSWQWVASTGSHKPYVFNAENVAKYAPSAWHSPATPIDLSYAALDAIARDASAVLPSVPIAKSWEGVAQPPLHSAPPDARWSTPDPAEDRFAGRDVCVLHPWSLATANSPPTATSVTLAIGLADSHRRTPWSARRWAFVTDGLAAQTPLLWWGEASAIAAALRNARSVHWQPDPHIDAALARLRNAWPLGASPQCVARLPADLFSPVDPLCQSFAQWWRRTQLCTDAG